MLKIGDWVRVKNPKIHSDRIIKQIPISGNRFRIIGWWHDGDKQPRIYINDEALRANGGLGWGVLTSDVEKINTKKTIIIYDKS